MSVFAPLDVLVRSACAITDGAPGSAAIDERALLGELVTLGPTVLTTPVESIPHLERLEQRLRASVERAPADLAHAASSYRWSTVKWRPEPPPMPREIVAFVLLERLVALRRACEHALGEAAYAARRRPGDRCDCAARLGASFYDAAPSGPLRLVDSVGVPYAAVDALWTCEACGAMWAESEAHDDLGAHVTWSPAPKGATRA